MDIKFYNSLTNKIEKFETIKPNNVSMYVCGPTVYNTPHIGNMRPIVVFDTLRRFLSYVGYDVTYVSNYTDVDDKIIKEAIKENKSELEITNYYINKFEEAVRGVGSLLPNITPRVTDYIDKIIDYVDNLVHIGAAYVVDGDVYFRVSKIKDYGALSGINIDDLKIGARIDEDKRKESPLDFALWKKTSEGITWPSPWGNGRPGWHTECCVMIDTLFKDHFIDIHGGGYDLKFPHHENEIAQAEATHNNKIAKYWMHNAFVNFGKEKMSKSLGNVVDALTLEKQIGGAVVRMVILSTHYRQAVNYTDETVEAAKQEINKITFAYRQLLLKLQLAGVELLDKKANSGMDEFLAALADDLNTANALSELFNLIKKVNAELRNKQSNIDLLTNYYYAFKDMLSVLGLDIEYHLLDDEDKQLYQQYLSYKNDKNFEKSDELRVLLIEKKII